MPISSQLKWCSHSQVLNYIFPQLLIFVNYTLECPLYWITPFWEFLYLDLNLESIKLFIASEDKWFSFKKPSQNFFSPFKNFKEECLACNMVFCIRFQRYFNFDKFFLFPVLRYLKNLIKLSQTTNISVHFLDWSMIEILNFCKRRQKFFKFSFYLWFPGPTLGLTPPH